MRPIPDWVITDEYTDDPLGVLKSGKEAEIFVVERTSLDDASLPPRPQALPTQIREAQKGELGRSASTRASSFVNDRVYRSRRFRRSREQRAVERMTDHGKRILNERWMGFEHEVMTRVWEAGAPVPYPVGFSGDGMLLEFVRRRLPSGADPRPVPA